MGLGLIALAMLAQDVPRFPPHYSGVAMTCPVGGEAFTGPSLMHYSTFGSLPDGEPIGSIDFPILMAECPGNGLIIYDKFTPEAAAKLTPLVASDAYKAMRKTETPYYRAHWLAARSGNAEQAAWLLLSATWEAKGAGPEGERARRYNEAFVVAVRALPADASSFGSIALRARAANALRELGRFNEAEAMRAAIAIAPDAGGEKGKRNREGWSKFLVELKAPIVRHDATRHPIDLMMSLQAAWRCLAKDFAEPGEAVAPLTPFETEFCARPEIAQEIEKARKSRAESDAMQARIRAEQKQ